MTSRPVVYSKPLANSAELWNSRTSVRSWELPLPAGAAACVASMRTSDSVSSGSAKLLRHRLLWRTIAGSGVKLCPRLKDTLARGAVATSGAVSRTPQNTRFRAAL